MCRATQKITIRPGRCPIGSRYTPILFPPGKGLWRPVQPPSSLSGWEEIIQCQGRHQFCFRLGTYFGVLQYAPVLSPTGNRSCRFMVLNNSLSSWKRTLEGCTTHQFYLRPGRDLGVSLLGMPRIPTHKAHAETPAYQGVKVQLRKIHLGLA